MAVAGTASRFEVKFRQQVQFLQRSCGLYDAGHEDEALRMATTLRILFHDTGKSTSLVSHLSWDHRPMLSSARGFGNWQDFLSHRLDLTSPRPVRMIPLLGDQFSQVSISHWWAGEPMFVHAGQPYFRRTVVLSAANKEHLEPYYDVLCKGEYAFGLIGDLEYNGPPPFPQGVPIYADNAHLALIRQFAHEVLSAVGHFRWLG